MFTGIIEEPARVTKLRKDPENLHITVRYSFTNHLKVDQSRAHKRVCLTIFDISDPEYTVAAISDTLKKSNFKHLKLGSEVTLERAVKPGGRPDGHIVQRHVNQTAVCTGIREADATLCFSSEYNPSYGNPTIEKGSVSVNGTSLTVINSKKKVLMQLLFLLQWNTRILTQLKLGTL